MPKHKQNHEPVPAPPEVLPGEQGAQPGGEPPVPGELPEEVVEEGSRGEETPEKPPEVLPEQPPEKAVTVEALPEVQRPAETEPAGEQPPVEAPSEETPTGRTLAERTRAHVEEQVKRDPDMRDLTPKEAYAEVEGTEDIDYDLRETCRELTKLTATVGDARLARGQYIVEHYYPPIEFSKRLAAIYWHNRPKPRFHDLMKFKDLPCSKSELGDDVQLYLQKRQLDFEDTGPSDYTHMSISQLILLTRVKDLGDKVEVIEHLKKHPKKYVETKAWMRAKGYINAAKEVDQTKKLVEGFERVVKNAEANLPALDAADPHSFGFNILAGWRERLGVVVTLLAALEEEEQAKAA